MADVAFLTTCLDHHEEEDGNVLLKDIENTSATPAAAATSEPPAAAAAVPSSCRFLKRKRPTGLMIPPVLMEIPLGEVGPRSGTAGHEDVGLGSARGPGWGVFSKRGRRKKAMEDAHRVVSGPQGHPDKSFFGVYDGHGGRKAVEYVVENLHTNVFNTLGDFDDRERGEAIKAAFLKTDQEFLKQGVCSGSCCVTALIEKEIIVVSNLGDCRAVLSRGGIAEALTNDHTASRVDEQERIKKKGGCIEDHNGAWRVQGILAVTRSIGDIHLKDWILAEPDTVVAPLVSDMELLILASDGLWNKVGNQEAVDVATQMHNGKNSVRTKTDVEADENLFGCENTSPPAKLRKTERVAIQIHNGKSIVGTKTDSEAEENVFGCENTSPPAKLRKTERVAIQIHNGKNIVRTKTDAEAEENVFGCENTSPPAKLRKRERAKQQKSPHCPGKELDRTESPGLCSLTMACKRLATIATTRGSLDDITVMIIDLSHFLRN